MADELLEILLQGGLRQPYFDLADAMLALSDPQEIVRSALSASVAEITTEV